MENVYDAPGMAEPQHKNVIVEIEKTSTGEVRTIASGLDWYDHSEFFWTDGNFGCDCNRSLVFQCGAEEGDADEPEADCGVGEFRVVSIKAQDGKLLFSEPTA